MTEQEQKQNPTFYWVGMVAVVLVVLAALWLLLAGNEEPSAPVVTPRAEVRLPETAVQPVSEPEPAIEVAQDVPETAIEAPAVVTRPQPAKPEAPLPALDQSDADVRQHLLALDWRPGLASLFVTDDMLRSFTVQVDNIAQGSLAKGYPLLQPLEQRFSVAEGGAMQLDQTSFTRFEPYINLLESVPPAKLMQLFNRYEPLLQKAYAEQGYPDELFRTKLLAAIDVLLATPEINYPQPLVRPGVMYQFADAGLEALPAAQKQMLRLGPQNLAKVKALLRQFQSLLKSS